MEVIYILHVVVCVLLICVILLQDGKTGGLVSVADNTQAVFGAKGASNFLTKLTTGLAIIFMALSLFLAWEAANKSGGSIVDDGDIPVTQPAQQEGAIMNPETGEMMPLSDDDIESIETFKADEVPEHIRNPQVEDVGTGDDSDQPTASEDDGSGDNGNEGGNGSDN